MAHAYLFFGWNSDGLLKFSRELANFLENRDWSLSERPLLDALFLNPDEYRLVKNFLWQKPIQSLRKTVVIQNAEELTAQAQNAILKIAEEPPASSLIILLIKDPAFLIPTLASRFQKIYIVSAPPRLMGRASPQKVWGENETNNKMEGDQEIGVGLDLAQEFLRAAPARRREIIKEAIEDGAVLKDFISYLIKDFSRDKIKNWEVLKELLYRWSLINRFNVNKKLQLEAALMNWNGSHT